MRCQPAHSLQALAGRVAAGLLALFSTLPARARGTPPPAPAPFAGLGSAAALSALGPLRGPQGAWVEYAVRSKGRPPGRVRVSLLPEPAPAGRRWLEIDSASAAGLAVATKVLLREDAAGAAAIERLLVLVAGQPPFELPLGLANSPAPRTPREPSRPTMLGEEQVTVPAGSFRASRVRMVEAASSLTVWRSEAVPLWGIVRTRGAAGGAELRAFSSTGARSVFPGGADSSAAGAPSRAQGNGSESAK